MDGMEVTQIFTMWKVIIIIIIIIIKYYWERKF